MHPESCPAMIPMPPLSDETVVEIYGFLQHIRELFEFHYCDQIYRYHKNQCRQQQQSPAPSWPANQDDLF